MRVCMITSYPPDKCGVSDYSCNLASSLKKNRNLKLLIISREGHSKNAAGIIAKKRVKRSLTQVLEELKGLKRAKADAEKCIALIKKFNADVVHIQYEPGMFNLFFVPMLINKLKKFGIKTVVTLHAIDYFPLSVFHKLMLYGKPDRTIVHTETHKKIIKNADVIPMGLTPRSAGAEKKYFLFFGFLNQHKGVEDLLKAFSIANCEGKLVLLGSINPAFKPDVEYKDRIETLIKQLGLRDRVEFVYDFVPFSKLFGYIKHAMFVVFPYRSSYSGGQSQAILDVLAFGKPLIVTERARGNLTADNAVIVKPNDVSGLADAIKKLSGSGQMRNALSRNNKLLAKKLSWHAVAEKTYRLYAEIST